MLKQKPRLVVIGNGMAGIRCLEEILKLDPDRFEIAVIGDERRPNYNRIMLSKVLQGSASLEDIVLNPYEWYREHGIALHTGERAVRIHAGACREVETASGMRLPWDRLIVATGSSAFVPPIPGTDKKGVISFRNLEDCNAMIRASEAGGRAAVIGGGLLGLEAARGLLNLGMETEVVHNAPFLMNRQLDETAAKLLRRELENQGMRFRMGAHTESITGPGRARGLLFSDGTRMRADLVVLAVGIKPNTELAAASGIRSSRGILVDDELETNLPGVYAIGECAEHRGIAYGLVAPLFEQAKVLARRLCEAPTEPYRGSILYAQLKVSGVDVFSAGEIRESEADVAQRWEDGIRGVYRKVTMKEGRIVGAILYGDTAESGTLLKQIRQEAFVSALPSGSGGQGGAREAAAALPEGERICACGDVSKAEIVQAVMRDGLTTADQVKQATGASGSCGGCRPMVAALVEYAKSGGAAAAAPAEEPEEEAVCGCVPFGRSGLKSAAKAAGRSLPANIGAAGANAAVLREIRLVPEKNWEGGCGVCRPAVLYYLFGHAETEVGDEEKDNRRGRRGTAVRVAAPAYSSAAAVEAGAIGRRWSERWEKIVLPGPVEAAVSAGPDYPAGVPVRDIGLRRCPAGWEFYAGGHAEHPVRQGELIGIMDNAEDAAAIGDALLQLYREEAFYDEPLWEWFGRIGLRTVREVLLDRTLREELALRFERESKGVAMSGAEPRFEDFGSFPEKAEKSLESASN
ncbi:FAD-dependent oxidoreductase [Saccharibacillus alkalitolerans]|uniref:NAD(P)/FAD-dependent oxidoreductase n=1 Tax=Saccharibacillus alkalitolerans TaxID=2705290 RepID=A0ABX0F5E6_9BACL|nr:FAD-dependent oxidoreductase [Saccharibacillus alkalitolerans]NGZ75598.1 NAD(P)/FAD-dependent oxidoreductase [Saccharibacillus alkalitolerans]